MSAMSQNMTVLSHLKKHGSITSIQAFSQYGITRISARIYDLRSTGHQIESEMIGEGFGRYAEYRLLEEQEQAA